MLKEIIANAASVTARWFSAVAHSFRNLLAPASAVPGLARDVARSRSELIAENALLRHQLIVARRGVKRPVLRDGDRLLLILLSRLNRSWRGALHLVQPDTLLRWHRDLFKILWRRRSSQSCRAPRTPQTTIDLIKKMTAENTWGAERIRGELLKLGIRVSKRTVQRYMRGVRDPGKPSQKWTSFLANHASEIWACDFIQTFDAWFRPVFGFFIVEHESRRVIHFNVTRSPTAAWTAQQLREATPDCCGPRFLICDNDDKFGTQFDDVAEACNTKIVRTAFRAPRMNAICECFLGSVRRECLDHILILGESHLRRVLGEYVRYHRDLRPHQGLSQRTPSQAARGEELVAESLSRATAVTSTPVLGGLHHDYRRAA